MGMSRNGSVSAKKRVWTEVPCGGDKGLRAMGGGKAGRGLGRKRRVSLLVSHLFRAGEKEEKGN